MSTKLYVGNLAFQTTSQELQELFAQAGTVESASVVEDRDTGRSRGFGFVEMSSKEEGAAAIAQFNGKEVNGRNLNVNEAKPRENRGGGGGRGFGGGGGGGRGGFGGGFGGLTCARALARAGGQSPVRAAVEAAVSAELAVGATVGTATKAINTGLLVQDAFGEWKVFGNDYFILDAGKILIDLTRNSNQSTSSHLSWDGGTWTINQSSVPLQGDGGRDVGFQIKSYLANDHLEFRGGVFDGFRAPANAGGAGSRNPFRVTGRVVYNFFDTEKGYVPVGTNLGKKKILAIGGGYDTQGGFTSPATATVPAVTGTPGATGRGALARAAGAAEAAGAAGAAGSYIRINAAATTTVRAAAAVIATLVMPSASLGRAKVVLVYYRRRL